MAKFSFLFRFLGKWLSAAKMNFRKLQNIRQKLWFFFLRHFHLSLIRKKKKKNPLWLKVENFQIRDSSVYSTLPKGAHKHSESINILIILWWEMFRLWKWYQNSLAVHPIKTQVISSGLIWGFGDIAAQTITHSTAKSQRQIQTQVKIPISGIVSVLNFLSTFMHFLLLSTVCPNGSWLFSPAFHLLTLVLVFMELVSCDYVLCLCLCSMNLKEFIDL